MPLKTYLIFACLLFTFSLHAQRKREYLGWSLVWSDEFNVEGKPNPDNWKFEKGFVRNHELQWYQPDNAYCKKGKLIIEAVVRAGQTLITNPIAKIGKKIVKTSNTLLQASKPRVCTVGNMGVLRCVHALIQEQVFGLLFGL